MNTPLKRNEEIKTLLIKAADGELTAEERDLLEKFAAEDPSLKEEVRQLSGVKEAVARFGLRNPNPGDWEQFEKTFTAKTTRWTGWLAFFSGYLSLVVAGLYFLFTDPEAPWSVKLAVGGIMGGFAIIFAYVFRNFIKERKEDPYKNIIR